MVSCVSCLCLYTCACVRVASMQPEAPAEFIFWNNVLPGDKLVTRSFLINHVLCFVKRVEKKRLFENWDTTEAVKVRSWKRVNREDIEGDFRRLFCSQFWSNVMKCSQWSLWAPATLLLSMKKKFISSHWDMEVNTFLFLFISPQSTECRRFNNRVIACAGGCSFRETSSSRWSSRI